MITPNSVYVEQYVDTAEMEEEEKALQIEQDGNSKIHDSLQSQSEEYSAKSNGIMDDQEEDKKGEERKEE